MASDISRLEKKLGINFKDKTLLQSAFVHRSYLNENPNFELSHNERLEFLGDACLELVVTEHLYKNYPNPEGELTNWRSALVRGQHLSEIAKVLDLEQYLHLSKGEQKSIGRARDLILANAFEALTGAIYLDRGYKVTQKFITKNVLRALPEIIEKHLYIDPKSRFQEMIQEKTGITPSYRLLKEEGPDHAKMFTMGIYIDNKLITQGTGPSKQVAEQSAAAHAIEEWADE